MIFMKRNDSYLLPWSLDYKFVIFSLAQIRPYILRGIKQDRTIASDIKLHIN